MEIEPPHIFDACCSLAVLSMENHITNRDAFLSNDFLRIDYKKLPKFIKTFYNNFQNMYSDTACLSDKNDVFLGFDNFYQWHESFGVINLCRCSACRRNQPVIEDTWNEFGSIINSYEELEIEISPSSYDILNNACNNLNKVSQYAYKHFDTQSAIEPIPYKIISTIRQDMGIPCDDEGERIKRYLSSSYVSFYERNIVNYSLSLLGDDYLKLKQQVWGVAIDS